MLAVHGASGGFHDGVKSAWADSPHVHGEQPALGGNSTSTCVLPVTVVRATLAEHSICVLMQIIM